MRRTPLLILLFLLLGAAPGVGQSLTEEVFLAAVDDAHAASRALAGELGTAEAEHLRATLLSDPRLEVMREAPEGLARETTLGIAWTPPLDGRRRWAAGAAEARVEAERLGLVSRRAQLRLEVRAAYAAWAAEERRVSLAAEHGARLEELARRVRHRAEAGEESNLTARRLEIAFASSQVALSRARAEEARMRAMAAAWLDGSGTELSAAETRLPDLPAVPGDLDASADWSRRPDVLATRAGVEAADALTRLSRRIPAAPEVMVGWKSVEEDLGRDADGPVFALGWNVPLFDRRRADRMAADSAAEVALADQEWTARRAQGELAAAFAAYEELRNSALAAKGDLEDLAGLAQVATAAFELGESSVTDLLDTLQAILEIRLDALDLQVAALDAHRRLELAAGRSLPSGDKS